MPTLSQEERFAFDLRGYLHLPRVLPRAHVARLVEALEALERLPAAGLPRGCVRSSTPLLDELRLRNLVECGDAFTELATHPAVLARADAVVPAPMRITDSYSVTRRRGVGLPLHNIPLASYTADRTGPRTSHLTAVFCLTDCGPLDGPMVVIAGSHKSAYGFPWSSVHADWRVPAGAEDAAAEVLTWIERSGQRARWEDLPGYTELCFEAGDVIVFTEDLWHGGKALASDRARRTLYFSYSPYHWVNWHGLQPTPELLARSTGRLRQLLAGPFAGNTFEGGPPLSLPAELGVPHLRAREAHPTPACAEALRARLAEARARCPELATPPGRLWLDLGAEQLQVDLCPEGVTVLALERGVSAADVCVRTPAATLQRLILGTEDPVALFYRGELELRGDVALAMRFAALLAPL